jgi:hypothetical protein
MSAKQKRRPTMPLGRPTVGPEKLDERVAMLLTSEEKDRLVEIALGEKKTISTLLREATAEKYPSWLKEQKDE